MSRDFIYLWKSLFINYAIIKLLFFLLNSNLPCARCTILSLFSFSNYEHRQDSFLLYLLEIIIFCINVLSEPYASSILLQWRYIKFVAFLFFYFSSNSVQRGNEVNMLPEHPFNFLFYFLDGSEAKLSLEDLIWPEIFPSARAGPLFSFFIAHGSF